MTKIILHISNCSNIVLYLKLADILLEYFIEYILLNQNKCRHFSYLWLDLLDVS